MPNGPPSSGKVHCEPGVHGGYQPGSPDQVPLTAARDRYTKQSAVWFADYAEKELGQLVRHVFPRIGDKPVRDLASRDLLDVLQRIEKKGSAETAHRVRRSLSAIMRYAVLTHRSIASPPTCSSSSSAAATRRAR